jgi:aminopeptidase N
MNYGKTMISVLFSLMVVTCFADNQKPGRPHVDLQLTIHPVTGHISGVAEYKYPTGSVFLLTKDLTVDSVVADGKKVDYVQSNTADWPFSTEYTLPFCTLDLVVKFSGVISDEHYPKSISNQNRITSQMIELTDVIDWYPRFKNDENSTYTLSVKAPANFEFVTNGMQTKTADTGETKETRFESKKPVSRIFLIGSAGMKNKILEGHHFTVEIYHTKLPEEYIERMIKNLAATVEFYENLYHSAGSNNRIKIIYSPRPAGGYARGSVILVSEEFAFDQIKSQWGFARDFQLNAHEIAHLWSKAHWEDDWINEGLAEYSAFLASGKFIGTEFSNLLLSEYNSAIENSATQLSILETTGDSWESHINRYYKPAVLLNALRQKYGEAIMTELIASLYAAFIQNHGGTTKLFLQTLEEKLGKEAYDFFTEGLNRKNWNKVSDTAGTAYDADFEGTWTGGLTQFGTTSKFVLHLNKDENKLIPVLDSPDQDVFGIPVSELQLSGDSITCVVGVASATFSGKLDRKTKTIHGNWNQRGTDYPLNISKE